MNEEKKSILIVDDDQAIGDLLCRVFSSIFDWNILYAQDGELGLAMWRQKHYDLVITDLQRPGLNGKALINIMRKENPEAKIVVLTGGQETDVSGAIAVLHKPMGDICEFAKSIESFLSL